MSNATAFIGWPSCVDAIDWSPDGIISFATHEQVELAFPQSESGNIEHNSTVWHKVPLPVTWYTPEELPDKEAAPFTTYSIGEEISNSIPVSVAWSPPGVAQHRRCALGVLTSNSVLSIWASEGKVEEVASWKRRLIINDALKNYFLTIPEEIESSLTNDATEKLRIRTRVRSFAWAPPLPGPEASVILGTQLTWGQPIVAIANDDNQIVFVAVDSPTTTLGADEDWSGEVLNHFSIVPDSEKIFSWAHIFDDIMQQQRFISHVSWSPWTVQGGWYHSVLVYATNDDIRARVITYSGETIGMGDEEVIYPDLQLRFSGIMKWSPKVEDGHKVTLAVFSGTGLTVLTISTSNGQTLTRQTNDLEERWDEVSAAVWDHTIADASLHVASLHSTLRHPTAGLKLTTDALSALPAPLWRQQLSEAHALFSAEHELKGHARTKVWGMSTSPLGDFIATCSCLHPSDMIEYGPPNDRRSTVAISRLQSRDAQANMTIPEENCTAEGLTFTLHKWLHANGNNKTNTSVIAKDVATKLFSKHYRPTPRGASPYTPLNQPDALRLIVTEVKQNLFFAEHQIKDRLTILASQICSQDTSMLLQKTMIAYRLATSTSKLPDALARSTPFSIEIREHHRHVVNLINVLMQEDGTNPAGAYRMPPCDICEVCGSGISMTDLTSASCANGHQFPRCGISFLAIQAPRITKVCGLCKTPFLSEEFVRLQEFGVGSAGEETDIMQGSLAQSVEHGGAGESSARNVTETDGSDGLPVSLARVLFLACDVCIYCGGKFTG